MNLAENPLPRSHAHGRRQEIVDGTIHYPAHPPSGAGYCLKGASYRLCNKGIHTLPSIRTTTNETPS